MYDPAISDKGAMLSAGRSHSRLNTNMFLPKHAVRRTILILQFALSLFLLEIFAQLHPISIIWASVSSARYRFRSESA